jgi:hypothetical protein
MPEALAIRVVKMKRKRTKVIRAINLNDQTKAVNGNWWKIPVPLNAEYIEVRPTMKVEADDEGGRAVRLDIEGRHQMTYTPWKLVKETEGTKVWLHDDKMIQKEMAVTDPIAKNTKPMSNIAQKNPSSNITMKKPSSSIAMKKTMPMKKPSSTMKKGR